MNALENSRATRSHYVRCEKHGMTEDEPSFLPQQVTSNGVPVEAHDNANCGENSTTENRAESGVHLNLCVAWFDVSSPSFSIWVECQCGTSSGRGF